MHASGKNDMPGGEAFALGYGIAVYEAAVDYLETHRHELVGAALRHEIDNVPGPRPSDETADAAVKNA